MHKLVASIMLIAFLAQSFNQGWYYLSYLAQKKEYMKQCVNKSRPQMHCDGRCQLMKKIEEQDNKEQGQAPEMKLASKAEVLSSTSSFLISLNFSTPQVKNCFLLLNSGIPVDQPSSIFHPPPAYC